MLLSQHKSKILTALAVIVGLIVTATLVTASIWPVLNVVETGKTRAYPDVLPQYFSADPKRVFDEIVATVPALAGWEVVQKDAITGTISATRTGMFGFVDDISISVSPETEFVTSVNVTSKSRAGKGDLGQNARNIREIQAEIEARLGAVRFDPYAAAEAGKP